jgi:chorismate mutase/prephenate dehydratase
MRKFRPPRQRPYETRTEPTWPRPFLNCASRSTRWTRDCWTLLNRRAALANEVGHIKRAEGSVVFRPEREAQVIHGLQERNAGPLKADSLAPSGARSCRPAARWRHASASPSSARPAPSASRPRSVLRHQHRARALRSIDEVFRATAGQCRVRRGAGRELHRGVVVSRRLDLLLNTPLQIVGETSLLVRHHLLRWSRTRWTASRRSTRIRRRWRSARAGSTPTCRMPERRTASSNAEGARLAAHQPAWAGIASDRAASEFGLHIAAHAIQDDAFNRTRFA